MGLLDVLKKKIKQGPTSNGIGSYVVFDFETTGLSRYYSEIIQISAIRVVNGKTVAEFDRLIRPKKLIPEEATLINHITNDMVRSAPSFKSVINEFLEFINGSLLIGYNISGFDLPLLNNRLYMETGHTFSAKYVDVLNMARQVGGLCDYKLVTLAQHFGISTDGAHNAFCDCIMTNACFKKLCEQHVQVVISEYAGVPVVFMNQLNETSLSINILRDILNGIVEDGKIDEREFNEIRCWVKENKRLKGAYPFDNISKKVDEILEDGVVQKEELDELVGFIDEWLDPVGHARHRRIESLAGRHVVLTGDFEYGSLDKVEKYVIGKGAIIDNSTLKKTELVIVGALGSKAWVTNNYGNKIKKALENRAKGQLIEIITEYDFFEETKNL